jgi:membrane protein involved in colicin uptake
MSNSGTQGDELGKRKMLRDVVRPGVIGSFVLHVAVLALLLYQVGVPPVLLSIIPVEVVQLAEQTTSQSPQPNATAAAPGVGTSDRLASVAPPRAARPSPPRAEPAPAAPTAPPSAERPAPDTLPPARQDSLQNQLDALAKLRMPNGSGTASQPSGNNGPASAQTGYRVEDLIRAQVQRRWNLRLDELGERELIVTIHIVLEPDGTVAKAEIVDMPRSKGDDAYRSIAISARNAVLLSSPLTLPKGMTAEMRDMMISFNTRDSLR